MKYNKILYKTYRRIDGRLHACVLRAATAAAAAFNNVSIVLRIGAYYLDVYNINIYCK